MSSHYIHCIAITFSAFSLCFFGKTIMLSELVFACLYLTTLLPEGTREKQEKELNGLIPDC